MSDRLDEINWKNRDKPGGTINRESVVRPIPIDEAGKRAVVAVEGDDEGYVTVNARPGEKQSKTKAKIKVGKLMELIESGLSPETAAEQMGLSLDQVNGIATKADMSKLVKSTIETGYIQAGVRKEFFRAGLNKMAAEALQEGDRRGFYEGYKLAASDPEMALSGPSTVVGVSINIEELGSVLASLDEGKNPIDSASSNTVTLETVPNVTEVTVVREDESN